MSTETSDRATLLAEHYQQSNEIAIEARRLRDRTFVSLLVLIAVGTLLTYDVDESQALFIDVVAKLLDISEPTRREELRSGFPFTIVKAGVSIGVFYLMANLYQYTVTVLRTYRYLHRVEDDLRRELALGEAHVSFTREGGFYWTRRPPAFARVKYVYFVILGGLLTLYLGGRVASHLAMYDPDSGLVSHVLLAIAEAVVGAATAYYFVAYVKASRDLDVPDEA